MIQMSTISQLNHKFLCGSMYLLNPKGRIEKMNISNKWMHDIFFLILLPQNILAAYATEVKIKIIMDVANSFKRPTTLVGLFCNMKGELCISLSLLSKHLSINFSSFRIFELIETIGLQYSSSQA